MAALPENIKENDSKLSHSCGIQVFHLLIFGLDLIFDFVITFVTIKGSFEIDTAEGSGSNYLVVNTIFFAVAQSLLLEALFLVMIVRFQRPS